MDSVLRADYDVASLLPLSLARQKRVQRVILLEGLVEMRVLIVGLFAGVFLAGCGSSGPPAPKPSKLVEVTGKVTLNGEPVEGAIVIFTPNSSGGFVAQGFTDSAGQYSAETRSGNDIELGVAPGSYRVMISRFLKPDGTPVDPAEPPAMSAARESIPMEYSSPTDSKLRATIGSNGGTFDFAMKGK